MNKIDAYIILGTCLTVGLALLYFGEDMYSGIFLGLFIAFVRECLSIKEVSKEPIKEPEQDLLHELILWNSSTR